MPTFEQTKPIPSRYASMVEAGTFVWGYELQALQARHSAFSKRVDALVRAREARTVAALHALDSSLPLDGRAFGMAHNWHACKAAKTRQDRAVGRVLDGWYAFLHAAVDLRARHWEASYGSLWQADRHARALEVSA